jgi:hypothetical protein
VKRFHSRLKAVEVVAGRCPGDSSHLRLRMYHATEAGAENLPPLPPCRLCGRDHTHEDGTPVIRRVVIIIPEEAAAEMPAEGYREQEYWRDG